MAAKPTYEELDQKVKLLEKEAFERKSAAKAMLGLEKAVGQSIDGIAMADLEGNIQFVNAAWAQMHGYTPEELIGRHLSIFHTGAQMQEEVIPFNQRMMEVGANQGEIGHVRGDGTTFPTWMRSNLIKDEEENIIGLLGIARDITDQKNAEKKMLEDEVFFESVFNSIQDGISVLDRDCNIVRVNKWMEKMYSGQMPLVGKKCYSAFQQRQSPCPWCPSVPTLETGEAHAEIVSYSLEDSQTGWIDLTTFPLKDASGTVVGIIEYVKDITAYKKVEEAFWKSEEKYKELANSLPQIIFETDESSKITFANHNAFNVFGYSQTEFDKGLNALDMLIPQDRERALENIQRVLNGEALGGVEYSALRKDGSTFPVSIHSNPIIRKNKPLGLRGIMIDLSEQKRYEEFLRESELRFRSLFDLSPQGIALTELDSGTLINVNATFCEITKYSMEELIGRSTEEVGFYSNSDRDRFIKELRAAGEVRGLEMDFKAKDGSMIKTLMFARPVNIAGKACILTVFLDLTEQKRLEFQLRQAQRMEAIGTLAGGIAHDFNNILFPIIGYTEMLIDNATEGSKSRDYLEEIFKEAIRARDLIRQILTFSRQSIQELKPMRVQPVVKEALKLLRSSIPATIQFNWRIDDACGVIMGDPTQIHQVIMNLCTNAYHAMEETGGHLEVSLTEIELGLDDMPGGIDLSPGRYIQLMVADTGQGMPSNVLKRIFDPYFTTKEEGKGTGLGLAVVHGIIKEHSGDIRVSSESGKGSVFHVYLPLVEIKEKETEIAPEPVQMGSERVLLVDDEETIVHMAKRMLEWLGYQVTSRTSSIEALEAFRAQPDKFELVITDMTMPNMSGEILAEELKKIRSDIPVILCTGFSEKISKARTIALGIEGFLMKPIVMSDLAKTIREVLDNIDKHE
ncbi:MAG: PAS domain S-box protein [Deltaproteobacteria bacterium]|nr:PAS domain S-box protein [Deltaproteobacteria bacterium]